MTSTTQTPQPGDIIKARRFGGTRKLSVYVLRVYNFDGRISVLGRRVRRNDDGTISTYGNDNSYFLGD